jgi:hypothetical protein
MARYDTIIISLILVMIGTYKLYTGIRTGTMHRNKITLYPKGNGKKDPLFYYFWIVIWFLIILIGIVILVKSF